jgi:hypothetical protein
MANLYRQNILRVVGAISTAAVMAAVIPEAAQAGSLTVNSVQGTWGNVEGAGSTLVGNGTNEIRWGDPATQAGKSGLRFDGAFPPVADVNLDENFVLGTLTHFNFPVYAPAATAADLTIALDLAGTIEAFDFGFTIDETPNTSGACPAFQQSGVPCDDKITFNSDFSSSTFLVGSKEYTLQLIGFSSTNDGSNPVSQFITQENLANNAFLVGRLTSPPDVESTPEPGTILGLMAVIGAGVGFKRRLAS